MNTHDAWKDYLGSRRYDPALVRSFTGVSPGSVRRWKGECFPLGETLLKLRVFLSLLGYPVDELLSLDGKIILAIEAVVLDQTTFEAVSEVLGLSPSSVRHLLMGERRTTPEKLADLGRWMTEASLGEKVSAARVSFSERLGLRPRSKVLETPVVGIPPLDGSVLACDAGTDHKAFIATAAAALQVFKSFLPKLLSENCSPEDRREFRRLVGNNMMVTSNQFFRLCSETARNETPTEGE